MAGSAGFSVSIRAVDQATGVLDRVNKRIEGAQKPWRDLEAKTRKFQKGLHKLGDLTGVSKLSRGVGALAHRAAGLAKRFAEVVPALGAITGAASLAGLYRLVSGFGAFGQKLGNQAARIGVTSDRLQTFQNAAQLAGVSGEAAGQGLQTLTDNLRNATGGRAPQFIASLRGIGGGLEQMWRSGATATQMLPAIANRIAAIKQPSDQARAAVALFGSAGEEMLPFLRQGADGLSRYEAEAKHFGVVNQAGVEAANKFQRSQVRVKLAVEGLGYSVAARVAPALSSMLNALAEWVRAHGKEIADAVGKIADRFKQWVDGGGLTRLKQQIEAIANTVDGIVKSLGGWKTVTEVLFGLWVAGKVAPMIGVIGSIGKAVGGITTAFKGASGAASGLLGKMALLNTALLVYEAAKKGKTVDQMRQQRIDQDKWLGGPDIRKWLKSHGMGWAARAFRGPDADIGPGEEMVYKQMTTPGERAAGGHYAKKVAPLTNPEQKAREKEAFDFFRSKGWSAAQAAGIVANIRKESGFNQNALGDGGHAHGLAQWHEDRIKALAAAGHRVIGGSFRDQLSSYNYELTKGAEKAAGNRLRAATSPQQAGAIVSKYYERPADIVGEQQERGALAESAYERLASQMPTAQPPRTPGQMYLPGLRQLGVRSPPVAAGPRASFAASGVPGQPGQPGAPGPGGTATVHIIHANAPEGTRMVASASGGLQVRSQVEQAFPVWAGP